MGGISARTVRLVTAKELLEALRDRRTLFVALVVPVLLYPMMMLGVAPLVSMQRQKLQDETQRIAVTGADRGAVIEFLESGTQDEPVGLEVVGALLWFWAVPGASHLLRVALFGEKPVEIGATVRKFQRKQEGRFENVRFRFEEEVSNSPPKGRSYAYPSVSPDVRSPDLVDEL